MRVTTRIGATLTLVGILLLVLANCGGNQTNRGPSAVVPGKGAVNALPKEPAPPVPPEARPGGPPTIFEALLSVIDSTDEGRAIDKEQRDKMRQELSETNEVWRGMKAEMKESIRRANQKFVIDPNGDVPAAPTP